MDKYKLQLAIYDAAHNRGWTREQVALLAYSEGAKDFSLERFGKSKLERILERIKAQSAPSLATAYDDLCECDDWRSGDHEANCAWVKFCKMFEMEK